MISGDVLQIAKDRAKRRVIELARRSNRLQTPMDIVIGLLRAYQLLPKPLHALEVFGMHGLWHTSDYYPLCDSLEFYEINPTFAAFAAKRFPDARVLVANSIERVREKQLGRSRYDLLVVDNPFGGVYGAGYVEHFDLFPALLDYMGDSVLIANFIYAPRDQSSTHVARRTAFYGRPVPTIDEAVQTYETMLTSRNLRLARSFFVPRNDFIGYLVLVSRA